MATARSPLSSRLQNRLAGLLGRIRGLRLVRGLAVTGLLLALVAGVAFGLDFALGLPESTRLGLLVGWVAVGVVGVCVTLVRLAGVPGANDLAALVEERYPHLTERLTSAVELDAADDIDPVLLGRLVREAEGQSARLRFGAALPARGTGLLASFALAIAAVLIVPAFVWPAYADLTRRFFAPWGTPAREVGYALNVESGDRAVRRGTTVTVRATLVALREEIDLPGEVALVAADGTTQTLEAIGEGVFTFKKVLTADLAYHLVAGEVRSPNFSLRALLPVELAPDQPVTSISPPLYATSVRDADQISGLVELEGLEHSLMTMQAQFTRPAVKAELHLLPRAGDPIVVGFILEADGLSGNLLTRLEKGGQYRIVTTSREGLVETIEGATLTVTRDRAPTVLERERRLPGLGKTVTLSPYDPLTLGFQAEDDIAIAGAWLEYSTEAEKVQSLAIDLAKIGPTMVQGRTTLKLAPDQLKAAGKLRYRLRLEDNKPKDLGGPNVTHFPADRWIEVAVGKEDANKGAEILAQRDSINLKLNQLIDDLTRQWKATNKLRQETREEAKLEAPQREQVREIEKAVRDAGKEIDKLVQEYQDERGLQPLLDTLEQVRKQEVDQAQQALKQAGAAERGQQPRDGDLAKADRNLDEARRKLEELRQKSNDLAQQRLDQARAEQLAREQEKLAEQAKELAAKDPLNKEQLAELEKKQQELAKELERLAQNSPALQEALKQLQPEMAKELGQKAEDLAREQRELAKQQEIAQRQPWLERLQDLAKKQAELAKKQEELGQKSKPQAESAAAKPLDPKEAREAVESLKQGDAQQASERQDKAAKELDNLAKNLDRAGELAKDPRKATEQLAKMQADLKQEVAKNPAARAEQLAKQKSLELATRELPVEKSDSAGQARKDAAAERMAEARKELEKNNTARAQDLMEMAKNYLDQLSRTQPNREQVQATQKAEVDRLRNQQEQARQLTKLADGAKTPAEREQKLAEAAKKQADTAEALSKLKIPEQAERIDKAREAANQAMRDLLDRDKANVPASQDEAKKQLDRLAQALRGDKPLDERVKELAQQQRELAKAAEQLAKEPEPKKDDVERLKKKQKDLAQKAEQLQVPEAQNQLNKARQAMQQAGQEQSPADLAKQAKQAAEDVDRLLRRVENQEKPSEQANRLADEAKDAPPGQLARELEQMRTPAEAQAQKEKAQQELKKAEDAKTPEAREQAKKQAAEDLRDLAKKLENQPEKPPVQPEKTPRQQAQELAQKQREIEKGAKEAQQEQTAKGAANKQNFEKKMQDLAQKQQDLNKQATKLPAEGQQKSLEETRQAMNKAQGSLEKKESGAAQQAGTAAQQLEKLAKSLPEKAPQPQAQNPPQPGQPAREQAEQARQLAQEQRELREQVRGTIEQNQQAQREQEKQLPDLAKQQGELAKQAQELAKQMPRDKADPHAAEKAQQAAKEAAEQLQRGEAGQAEKSAQQAIEQLKKLGEQMGKAGNEPGKQAAEELAKRQQELTQKLQQTPQNQQARQEDLKQRGQELQQQLQKLAEQMKDQPGTREAAKSGEQAQQAMQRAEDQAKQGNQGQAQQAREDAAQKLEQAGKQAQQAARDGMANRPMPKDGTSESLKEAREQGQQAQQQLKQQEPGQAQTAMQQAAQSLQKLAQQLMPESKEPMKTAGQVPEMGPMPGGLPSADALPPELAPYAGKTWGELPGELRTRIMQEARGRYGDDYARMIKLYFEQLATQRPKK